MQVPESLRRAWDAVIGAVARGRISGASQPGRIRPVLQVRLLQQEAAVAVELMAGAYGRSAMPAAGDVILLSIGGHRDDKVVIAVDNPALRIKGLGPGEFGDSDGASQIVFRAGELEISSTRPIRIQSDSTVAITGTAATIGGLGDTMRKLVDERFVALFNSHTHAAVGAPPSQTMAVDDHTTTHAKGG